MERRRKMSTKKYLEPEGMFNMVDGYLKKAGPSFQLKSTSKCLQLVAKNIEAMFTALGEKVRELPGCHTKPIEEGGRT